jgi:hypothetical protein
VCLVVGPPAPGDPSPCPAYLRQPRAAPRRLTRACNPSHPSLRSCRRLLTLAAPPPAAVVNPSCSPSGRSSEAPQGSKGLIRVICSRPCAPHHRLGLAGPPPPRLLAARRVEPSPSPQEPTVVFAGRSLSSWCSPRIGWCTPAPFSPRAATHRRAAAASPHRRRPCAAPVARI